MLRSSETFKVAGTSHYSDAIRSLAEYNDDYDLSKKELLEIYNEGDSVFQYIFPDTLKVNLIDEPDNQFDPNAIRVELNGVTVGYIKKGSTGRIRNLLKEPDIKISVEVFPGNVKRICEDDNGKVYVEQSDYNFGIIVNDIAFCISVSCSP